jgi:hypothetical protein
MSTTWLPCGDYHQNYLEDHAWFQTKFIKGKMILLGLCLFVLIPWLADEYWLSVANTASAARSPWVTRHFLRWEPTPAPCSFWSFPGLSF